jgi:hypothetical protein
MSVIAGIHPVIVLITVQGLLRITNRAGKLNYKFKDQSDSCFCPEQLFAPFGEFLKNYFNKNFAQFREDGSILVSGAAQSSNPTTNSTVSGQVSAGYFRLAACFPASHRRAPDKG